MSEWRTMTLDQVVRFQRGYDLPTQNRRHGSVQVVGAAGPSGFHDTAMVSGPGVVLGRAGASMGKATYIKEDFWPLNTSLFVTDFCGNNPYFVYRLLDRIDFSGFNSGAAQPMLNRNYIRHLSVRIPDRAAQDAITEVLGALDSKIEINNKIADTAQSLTLEQVSSSLRDSETSETLSKLAKVIVRGITPKYVDEGGHVILNQKCIRNGRVSLEPSRRTLASSAESKLLEFGDVLVNSTGVGTLGRVARWSANIQATVDSHVTIVRFDPDVVDPLCAALSTIRMQPTIERMGHGSTGQMELSRAQLAAMELPLPSQADQARLSPLLHALENRADAALKERIALEEIRGALLPKLMSGEIRVRDAEKLVGDAV